jgi:hypothetical protein
VEWCGWQSDLAITQLFHQPVALFLTYSKPDGIRLFTLVIVDLMCGILDVSTEGGGMHNRQAESK